MVDYEVEGMLPLSTVTKPEFKNRVAGLTKGNAKTIKAPSKHNLKKTLKARKRAMHSNIKNTLKRQKYLRTTTDLWSQNQRGFMGVTCHFLDAATLKRESVILACRRMEFHHTAEKVAEVYPYMTNSISFPQLPTQ